MPQVGFEPTIPVFKWVKTVHVLDRAATVINCNELYGTYFSNTAILEFSQSCLLLCIRWYAFL
jgi:hypothetical protein